MADNGAVCVCDHAFWLHESVHGKCKLDGINGHECERWVNREGKAHKYADFVNPFTVNGRAGRIASSSELTRPKHMRRYEYL